MILKNFLKSFNKEIMTSSMDPNAGFNGIGTVTPGSGAVRQVDFALTTENLDTETNSSHTFSDIIVTGTSSLGGTGVIGTTSAASSLTVNGSITVNGSTGPQGYLGDFSASNVSLTGAGGVLTGPVQLTYFRNSNDNKTLDSDSRFQALTATTAGVVVAPTGHYGLCFYTTGDLTANAWTPQSRQTITLISNNIGPTGGADCHVYGHTGPTGAGQGIPYILPEFSSTGSGFARFSLINMRRTGENLTGPLTLGFNISNYE